MIQSKKDLADYLEADKRALGRSGRPKFNDLIWKYEIALRYGEYYNNRRMIGGVRLKASILEISEICLGREV